MLLLPVEAVGRHADDEAVAARGGALDDAQVAEVEEVEGAEGDDGGRHFHTLTRAVF